MQKASQNRSSLFPVFATVLLTALAGCTTSGGDKPGATASADQPRVKASELRAYCPTVTLRDGTAFFSTYAKGGDKDPAQVIYQASLTDVTRACQYGDGTIPVRVAVRQGDQVVYSKLHKQTVTITNSDTATQFVFNDKGISLPMPDRQNIQIFVGFDEGPNAK
jgi:hypothetical protein